MRENNFINNACARGHIKKATRIQIDMRIEALLKSSKISEKYTAALYVLILLNSRSMQVIIAYMQLKNIF